MAVILLGHDLEVELLVFLHTIELVVIVFFDFDDVTKLVLAMQLGPVFDALRPILIQSIIHYLTYFIF